MRHPRTCAVFGLSSARLLLLEFVLLSMALPRGMLPASSGLLSSATAQPPADDAQRPWKPRPVPKETLLVGYSHDPSGSKVRDAIERGVNVVCWSFVHLAVDPASSRPTIRTDLDLAAVRSVREAPGYEDVLHVAAIGGWNGPHPPPGVAAEDWADAFVNFNAEAGHVFDGVDWDLEGNDDRAAPTSRFDLGTLDTMADVSKILKERHGFVVSMAPAESYLDALAGDDRFSLDLNLFPDAWSTNPHDRRLVEDRGFAHAGRQCYAYVLHRAGVQTFDWIAVQLYESYSRFLHESTVGVGTSGESGEADAQMEALRRRAVAFFDGIQVDLPKYGTVRVQVPPSKLVWGFANGWADGEKVVRVNPRTLNRLMLRLKTRGVMFWTVEEEGNGGLFLVDKIAHSIRRSFEDWHDLNDDVLPDEEGGGHDEL